MTMKDRTDKIIGYVKNLTGMGERDLVVILYIFIIILVNIAGVTLNLRFDLTRNNTYSLARKSRDVVANLNENLKIRVLFSRDLPAEHGTISRYLLDLLDEYRYYGNRYFSYEIVDEKDLKKQADDFGIRPVVSREFADDQVKTRQTYMGLVIQQADLIEKIDSVTDPVGLEYTITSRIEKITSKIDGLLKLKNPMTLTLYLDKRVKELPIEGIQALDKKVKEAVDKANVNNYGKIRFQLMEAFQKSETDALADKYGISKLKWPAMAGKRGERMEAGEGLMGLVLEKEDRFHRFDLSVGQALFGNYIITGLDNFTDRVNNAVSTLLRSSKRIGYVTSRGTADLDNEQARDGGALYKKLLSDIYDVVAVDLSREPIPDDVETLIINGPRDRFGDDELYMIDQFLLSGKSAVVFTDSFTEIELPQQQAMFGGGQPIVVPVTTGLEEMLRHYGVTVNRDIVLDTSSAKVNMGNMIKEYPLLPIIKKKGFDERNIITRYLQSVLMAKASSLTVDENRVKEKNLSRTVLISSSPESWLMTGRVNFNPLTMNAPPGKEMKSYPLAVLLSGKFDSFFKGKEAPRADDKGKKKEKDGQIRSVKRLDGTVASGTTSLIVVGTSEITRSGFLSYARKIIGSGGRSEVFSNDHLLHSFTDYLTGNHYIPEMSSKSLEFNPLDATGNNTRFAFKIINIAGVPIFVVLAGFYIWRGRAKRKRMIMEKFSREGRHE